MSTAHNYQALSSSPASQTLRRVNTEKYTTPTTNWLGILTASRAQREQVQTVPLMTSEFKEELRNYLKPENSRICNIGLGVIFAPKDTKDLITKSIFTGLGAGSITQAMAMIFSSGTADAINGNPAVRAAIGTTMGGSMLFAPVIMRGVNKYYEEKKLKERFNTIKEDIDAGYLSDNVREFYKRIKAAEAIEATAGFAAKIESSDTAAVVGLISGTIALLHPPAGFAVSAGYGLGAGTLVGWMGFGAAKNSAIQKAETRLNSDKCATGEMVEYHKNNAQNEHKGMAMV